MNKKFKVRLFEIALTESTDKERAKYEKLVKEFTENIPGKVLETLDDNSLINLFFSEKWATIKKECPFAFEIYFNYCKLLVKKITLKLEEINRHDEYMRVYRQNHKK